MEDREDALQKISDKELIRMIVRVKGLCKSVTLSEGGEKLRAHLRNLEVEWERRKLLKDLIYNMRKAGQIEVDWSKLLPSDRKDDEPPLVLMIEDTAEESEQRQEVMMQDKENVDQCLKKISNKELIENIGRVKGLCKSVKLSDGGENLRSLLRTLEAEWERRKLLKAVTYNLRKAGRIELDWSMLLHSERKDHETLPVLVIEETNEELKLHEDVMMEDREDMDQYMKKIFDKELVGNIARVE